mgnify:CR=1 FL=1
MPRIDLGAEMSKAKRLGLKTLDQLVVVGALRQARPYQEEIRAIDPRDIETFIQKGLDLTTIIPREQALNSDYPLGRLVKLSTDVVIEVLKELHPALVRVLDTPKGRAWWERQRQIYS